MNPVRSSAEFYKKVYSNNEAAFGFLKVEAEIYENF